MAQVLLDGGEFQINTYTTGDQYGAARRAVSRSADGSFVVVWASYGSAGTDTDGRSIQAQRYDGSGAPQGTEFQVNAYTTADQLAPAVAASADGSFVVVWASYGSSGTDGSGYSVEARRYDGSGIPAGVESQVNTHTTGDQFPPKVSASADGRFVVVWTSDGLSPDPSAFSVRAQRFTAGGTPADAEFQVNTYNTSDQSTPAVAMNGADGTFVVAWTSNGSAGTDTNFSIQAQRFASDGAQAGTEFQVNEYTTSIQISPAVSVDVDGSFVIVWTSAAWAGTDPTDAIVGRRYDSGGSPVGTEFQVNTYTSGSQIEPAVTVRGDGRFAVVWSSDSSSGNDDSYGSVQARVYDSDGMPSGDEFQVNTYTTDAQGYTVAVASGGDADFVVVWSSYYQDGYGYGVFGQRFCGDANTSGVCDRDETTTTTVPMTTTTVVSMPTCGNGVVEEGEQCDEGAGNGSNGCSLSCTLSGSCPALPLLSCVDLAPGKASAKIKRRRSERAPFDNSKDQLQLKLRNATSSVTGAEVGDPAMAGTVYSYCVYDAAGLVAGADVPAGGAWSCSLGTLGREQCKYKEKLGSSFGVLAVKVKAGLLGKPQALIKVKSKVAAFTAPAMPLTLPVTAQITSSAGLCLGVEFQSASKNEGGEKGQFQAKN